MSPDSDALLARVAYTPSVDSFEPSGRILAGRYRVVALVGRGGMGRVYEAEDLELGRRVAVKLIRSARAAHAEHRARFLRERSIAAMLEHPGIVPVYDAGVAPNGEPFYVMRLARGEPLDRRIEGASAEARLALVPSVIAVAGAVGFAHSRGVVHRDLKPANILVGDFGETLVGDWGLAAWLGDRAVEGSGGTRAYMAPEQAAGVGPIDGRVDVYGLGATLAHVLSGDAPGPALPGAIAWVPAALRGVVWTAMAADPLARYASVAEFAEALRVTAAPGAR